MIKPVEFKTGSALTFWGKSTGYRVIGCIFFPLHIVL